MNGQLLEKLAVASRQAAIPFEVLFEVTHRCNLPCKHCYLPDHLDHGELSLEEIDGLFGQLSAAGTTFLTLTGGEVLARSDFLQILALAQSHHFALKVLTNASMVTDEVADAFVAAGVMEVSVSVYGGTAEVHDAVTDLPGSFDRTVAGIRRMQARGLHVVVKTPLLTLNGGPARGVHELAKMNSMPCSFDLAITPKNNGNPAPLGLMLHRSTMAELMTESPFREFFLDGDGNGPGPEPCGAGRGYCAIGPTGDVMPCIMMPVVVGNVREKQFAALWEQSPFLQRLRSLTTADLEQCGTCGVKGSCTRCPGIAYQRGQGIEGCDLSGMEVARARVDARRRLQVVA